MFIKISYLTRIMKKYYLDVLTDKYSDFNGRARRKEYWMFVLFNIIFTGLATLISPKLYAIYTLAVLIPNLAVSVRRLHDVGKSGWMCFIALIPLIGAIWLLVLMLTDSNSGENEYGANPKEII